MHHGAVAKEPTAITDQTKSFEGLDRDAAHEAAMKWIDDLNQHGPLRIKRIRAAARGHAFASCLSSPPYDLFMPPVPAGFV